MKITVKAYPEAHRAAQAILDRCQLPYPLNVSRVLDYIDTHKISDLSSWTFNRFFADNDREILSPKKAWTLYHEDLDTYMIVWNKAQERASIRYSIAHEIGHILLNHERTWPTDRILRKRDKESEADAFARSLLAPSEAIYDMSGGRPFNAGLVSRLFDIPYGVAKKIRFDYEYWLLAETR